MLLYFVLQAQHWQRLYRLVVMFLMVLMLIVLLVCGDGSIVIIVWLLSLLSLSCPSHLINVVVVALATPPCSKG
jgi:hypothetical protein